jgi:hypothetical protein
VQGVALVVRDVRVLRLQVGLEDEPGVAASRKGRTAPSSAEAMVSANIAM